MSKLIKKAFLGYLLPIVLGGLIGGLLVGVFLVWPTVYGAKWWEVFTAIGTVGATAFSVLISVFAWKREEKERRRKWNVLMHSKVESCRELIENLGAAFTSLASPLRATSYGEEELQKTCSYHGNRLERLLDIKDLELSDSQISVLSFEEAVSFSKVLSSIESISLVGLRGIDPREHQRYIEESKRIGDKLHGVVDELIQIFPTLQKELISFMEKKKEFEKEAGEYSERKAE